MIVRLRYGWAKRDIKIRKNYTNNSEICKNILKSLLISEKYIIFHKLYFSKMFYIFKKCSSISKYRTACSFSLSGRVIFRKFKLSRMFCKYFASHGYLLGMRKSSF